MSKAQEKMMAHIAKIKEEFEPRNDEDCFYFPRPNFHSENTTHPEYVLYADVLPAMEDVSNDLV